MENLCDIGVFRYIKTHPQSILQAKPVMAHWRLETARTTTSPSDMFYAQNCSCRSPRLNYLLVYAYPCSALLLGHIIFSVVLSLPNLSQSSSDCFVSLGSISNRRAGGWRAFISFTAYISSRFLHTRHPASLLHIILPRISQKPVLLLPNPSQSLCGLLMPLGYTLVWVVKVLCFLRIIHSFPLFFISLLLPQN